MIEQKKAKVIAFYLPQFHPIPENDKWWGEGFTEWTNVKKAKPLFIGHYQPRIPADLGYYDLRCPEVRNAQAELAKEAGIEAFCYWHYWFGNGKQLLEKPLQEVVRLGEPDFPFCIGWANGPWIKRYWNPDANQWSNKYLIEQKYPDKEDIDNHFYTMLPMFKDKRYYKISGRLLFVFHHFEDIPNPEYFIIRWNELADINDLPHFYFAAFCFSQKDLNNEVFNYCDAKILSLNEAIYSRKVNSVKNLVSKFLKIPLNVKNYKKIIKKWNLPILKNEHIFPCVFPNWDYTARLKYGGLILHNSNPLLFKQHIEHIIQLISHKKDENKIVFLKSWNEWGEGNYMEPDLKYGKGYIQALHEALTEK